MATVSSADGQVKLLDKFISENTKAGRSEEMGRIKEIRDELQKLMKDAYGANDALLKITEVEFKDLVREADGLQNKIKETNMGGHTLAHTMKNMYERFGSWFGITRSLMAVVRMFKQMVGHVREVDAGMTELRKVTDETAATYARFLEGTMVRAQKLGATLADTVNASADKRKIVPLCSNT